MAASATKPKLLVIDGYSILFRAFFAPGPYLSTADGTPTAAVLVFSNTLLSLLDQEKPNACYVAWDTGAPTFRHESFAEYKAHRAEAGEDLKKQIPIAREIVKAMGIAAAEAPRFEADDLIGTLATRGVKEGYEVVILTGDTDQLQLVGDGVLVRMVRRGITETKLYDEAAVVERYGISPERIPDWKSLVGDTSDNIPGVPGIGEKGATKLLQEYGTLENLLAHVEDLPPGKVRDNLAAGGQKAIKSRELATIHCEAPFEGAIQPYHPTPEDWERARALFTSLEFRSLLRRLPAQSSSPEVPPLRGTERASSGEQTIVESDTQLQKALGDVTASGVAAIRLHADSPQPMRAKLAGIAFSANPERAWYVRIKTDEQKPAAGQGALFDAEPVKVLGFDVALDALRPLLTGEGITRIAHHAKYDHIVLARHGLEPGAFVFDAMIAAYLLSPGRSAYPLDGLAEEFLGSSPAVEGEAPEIKAAREAAEVFALHEPLRQRLEAHALEEIMYRVEMPLVPVLAEMELTGVPVDRAWLERLSEELRDKSESLTSDIYRLADEEFNIGSTQQLQRILFEKLKLPSGKKIKTGYSTGADVLEALAIEHEICAKIIEYREITKLKGTYADALPKLIHPETGRLHTSLNQTVAATGRLSSSDPNLQNIPVRSEVGREIRKAFIAPLGQVLLSCDYSQIELRVFAHVTRDPELVRAFEADEDIHAATAATLFNIDIENVLPEMRRRAKTVNFAVIYGQGEFGLAQQLGIPSAEAKAFIQTYFARFPEVRRWSAETLRFAREQGYVQTLLGRRRYLPDIRSGNFNIRQAAERAAVNMPIQGTAADIMKLAMIDVAVFLRREACPCTLLLQVHDELLFGMDEDLVPKLAPEIVHIMESAYQLEVPVRVDAKTGKNWAEMTTVKRGS